MGKPTAKKSGAGDTTLWHSQTGVRTFPVTDGKGDIGLIPVSSTQMPMPNVNSAPPPLPSQTAGDPIGFAIMTLNTNPYFIGMFMLLLNLGGRFLSLELTKKQEAFLQEQWIRPVIFFTVIFMATRNTVVAFWLTVLFFFIIWVVANENSPYCMIPSWCGHDIQTQTQTYQQNIEKLKQ